MSSTGERVVAGRYRLRRLLGQGAMGTVWEAFDEYLRRPVAVKEVLLPPGMPEDQAAELRERTLREARAIAALSHPNVITLHDVARDGDEPLVVMEYMLAHSLASLIDVFGPQPEARAAAIADAVAAGLAAAHQAGITHRDVKPGNVLIGVDGRVKLTDFGIARNVAERTLTSTGIMLGSPAYIAPEVAAGREVTPAADLWGLGATLFAVIEGRPPYDVHGAVLATVNQVVNGEVPRPSVGGPLSDLVAALMVKEPEKRISLREVRNRLHSLLPPPSTPLLAEEDLARLNEVAARWADRVATKPDNAAEQVGDQHDNGGTDPRDGGAGPRHGGAGPRNGEAGPRAGGTDSADSGAGPHRGGFHGGWAGPRDGATGSHDAGSGADHGGAGSRGGPAGRRPDGASPAAKPGSSSPLAATPDGPLPPGSTPLAADPGPLPSSARASLSAETGAPRGSTPPHGSNSPHGSTSSPTKPGDSADKPGGSPSSGRAALSAESGAPSGSGPLAADPGLPSALRAALSGETGAPSGSGARAGEPALAATPGPLPFEMTARAPAEAERDAERSEGRGSVATGIVAFLAVLLFFAAAGGGFALSRYVGGEPLLPPADPVQTAPNTPSKDQPETLSPRSGNAVDEDKPGGGFTVPVPRDWVEFVEKIDDKEFLASTRVYYASPDGTRLVTVERFPGFYSAYGPADYLDRLQAAEPGVTVDIVYQRAISGIDGASPEPAMELNYRATANTKELAPDDQVAQDQTRVTFARLLPYAGDLWVVSVTVPIDQEDSGNALFERIVPEFKVTG